MSSGVDKYTSAPALLSSAPKSSSSFSDGPQKPDMDVVDYPTQSLIERLCRDYERDGVAPYWNCLRKELNKLDGISKPDMDVVDYPTQSLIERLCRDYERDGVAPYWNCLRKELANIGITSTGKTF